MKSKNKYLRFKNVIGGWRTFVAILMMFGVGSTVIAATAGFPLPYDELYHVTLIQHYSQQWTPFITTQPAELNMTGDATRYGSYLAHYLLSFPLRVFSVFTNDVNTQVFLLRLINIGFVVGALVLFRKFVLILAKSGVSANGSVALLAALPVTSLLAATVNYDNLLLLIFAALLVMAKSIVQTIKSKQSLKLPLVLGFVALTLLGCLVKFTFLPLAAVLLAFMATVIIRRKAWPQASASTLVTKASLLVTAVLCIVAVGLFAERYVGNVIAYKSLQPDCSVVQPLSVCLQWGPWARNYGLEQAAATDTAFEGRSIQGYVTNVWAPLMIRGLGGVNDKGIVSEIPKAALLSLMVVATTLVVGTLGAAVMYRKDSFVLMTVLAMALYAGALLQRNYAEYIALHEIVAVQGRYVLMFVVPLVVTGMIGLQMYAAQSKILAHNTVRRVRLLGSIDPEEAYELSLNYWSLKVWGRRRLED